MGLEIAEFVMDLEDAFGIPIDEHSLPADSPITVGDIIKMVHGWIDRAATSGGGEAYALATLREEWEKLGTSKSAIQPSVSFGSLFLTKSQRNEAWSAASKKLALPFRRSPKLVVINLGILGITVTLTWLFASPGWAFLAGLTLLIIFIAIGRFGDDKKRAMMLVSEITANTALRGLAMTKEQAEMRVRELIAARAGVDISRVKTESRLVQDLGMD
jgi:acyl carrier protein